MHACSAFDARCCVCDLPAHDVTILFLTLIESNYSVLEDRRLRQIVRTSPRHSSKPHSPDSGHPTDT